MQGINIGKIYELCVEESTIVGYHLKKNNCQVFVTNILKKVCEYHEKIINQAKLGVNHDDKRREIED